MMPNKKRTEKNTFLGDQAVALLKKAIFFGFYQKLTCWFP